MLATSPKGQEALKGTRYVRLYSKGDRTPVDLKEGAKIVLSAFMNKTNDPVIEYSDRSYSVALSDHADFNGTLEYILATGATSVVTDNTRGHGVELAIAIKHRLGTTKCAGRQAGRGPYSLIFLGTWGGRSPLFAHNAHSYGGGSSVARSAG